MKLWAFIIDYSDFRQMFHYLWIPKLPFLHVQDVSGEAFWTKETNIYSSFNLTEFFFVEEVKHLFVICAFFRFEQKVFFCWIINLFYLNGLYYVL